MLRIHIAAAVLFLSGTSAYAAAPKFVSGAVASCCSLISACCEAVLACCG